MQMLYMTIYYIL